MKGNTNQAAAAGCVGAQPPPPPVTSTATTVATMSENMKNNYSRSGESQQMVAENLTV